MPCIAAPPDTYAVQSACLKNTRQNRPVVFIPLLTIRWRAREARLATATRLSGRDTIQASVNSEARARSGVIAITSRSARPFPARD